MPDAIRSTRLTSGATLLTERLSGVRSAALAWLLPVGVAADPADRVGRAALFAELLLRGDRTRNSRAQADAFDALGASRSASAGTFALALRTTCLGPNLADAAALLTESVRTPRFDPDSLEPARDLCLQTIESLLDDRQQRVMLTLRQRHLPEPINRPSEGSREGLAAITHDELRPAWDAAAVPDRSIIAAAGDVDHDALADHLNTLLDGWTGSTPEPPFDPASADRGYHHVQDQSDQIHIALAHDAPAETHPDAPLERLAAAVLDLGMASRLFTEVREKRGLVYAVHASYAADRDFGRTSFYAGTTPDRAQQTLDVILDQVRRLATPEGRVTPDEFERAVTGLKSRLVFSGESSGARARALAADQRKLGKPRSLADRAAEIDAVTLDRLNDYLARRELGAMTTVTLGPKDLAPAAP